MRHLRETNNRSENLSRMQEKTFPPCLLRRGRSCQSNLVPPLCHKPPITSQSRTIIWHNNLQASRRTMCYMQNRHEKLNTLPRMPQPTIPPRRLWCPRSLLPTLVPSLCHCQNTTTHFEKTYIVRHNCKTRSLHTI